MYYFCKKVNFIPLSFIFNIISLFTDNYVLPYSITIIYFISLTLKLLNKKINKLLINKDIIIIFTLFFTMIFTTIMNIDGIEKFSKLIKLFILIINAVIGLECALLFGKTYIDKGFCIINNIMMILNIEGIFEFIRKSNIYVEYIKNIKVKNWHIWSFGTDSYRNFSVFTHPIVYANILILSFWINHFLCKNKKLKNINYILILINLYATQSRSSWIGFFVTLLLYIISKKMVQYKKGTISIKNKIYIIIGIFIVIISFYIIPNTSEVIFNIFERFSALYSNGGNVSATQRLGTIEYIINEFTSQNIFDVILGNGFTNVSEMMKSTTIVLEGFESTDNQFISILWDFGVIGLALNIVIIIKSIKTIFNTSKSDQVKYINYIFMSISIPMFFYEMYGWYIISQIYFFVLGLLYLNLNITHFNR